MPDIPRLTIVIPTYNRPDLLPRALKSALAQTVPVRIIIADDGDDVRATRDVIKEWTTPEDHDSGRVSHLCTGAEYAWENWRAGALAATTEFVAWLQDDDIVRPTYAGRIVEAFDRHPDGDVWLARLQLAPDGRLGLWYKGNGPFVPMDLISGTPWLYREGSILASTSYFTSHSLSPAIAYRANYSFYEMLDAMPERCDIFVERLGPALATMGRPFIADPVIAGYWIHHADQLSRKQHADQPAQTRRFLPELDGIMDTFDPAWKDHLAAWCQFQAADFLVGWVGQLDATCSEGGGSAYRGPIQEILVKSLKGRVEFSRGGADRWWKRAARWAVARAAGL